MTRPSALKTIGDTPDVPAPRAQPGPYRVLFSSPWYPEGYRSQAWDNPVTDFGDLQFSGHQDIFTLHGHMHELFAHVICQNLRRPTVYLEYPRREQFLDEVDKGYDFVGIHCFYNQVEAALEMCKAVRQRSPGTKIILGGYGALGIAEMLPPDEVTPFADYLCLGEGVSFMRKLLGEDPNAPTSLTHLPRGGMTLPWQRRYMGNTLGVCVASLGCPYGCDFCGTTKMFNRRRIVLLSPKALADEVVRIYTEEPGTMMVAVYEEDSFLDAEYLEEVGEHLRKSPIGLECGLWVLGGIRSIEQWGANRYDRIARSGIASAFLGVESKFAGEEGYVKRQGNTREVFEELHRRGISTVGAWICGLDFHTRENIEEDLAFFLSLKPTFNQLSTLCPFPGTDLFRKMAREDRLPKDLRWKDLSFFGAGGGFRYKNFESHEVFDIIHRGYRKSYELWGPSLTRGLEVQLNGYEWALSTGDPDMARRAAYYRRMVIQGWTFLPTAIELAPNGMVRRKLREVASRYERLIGRPATVQRLLAELTLEAAKKERAMRQRTGHDRHVEIPDPLPVRYDFVGSEARVPGQRPWSSTALGHDPGYDRFRRRHNAISHVASAVTEAARLYDYLKRRTVPERQVVDDASAMVRALLAPVAARTVA